MATHDWYTIVGAGGDPKPARGPFRGRHEAEAAMERFQQREGSLAGTWLAAGSVRIVGPYCSRAAAQEADISDYGDLCNHINPSS